MFIYGQGSAKIIRTVIVHRLTSKANYTRLSEKGFGESRNPVTLTLYGSARQIEAMVMEGLG